MASINVNNLPAKAAAAITTDDQVMLFTASGDTTQTPFNEAVAQAQGLNECLCVKTKTLSIPSAQVLTLYTANVAFGITVPVGYYLKPIGCDIIMTYNSATYVAAGQIELRTSISAQPLMTSTAGLLEWISNSSWQMTPFDGFLGDTSIQDGSDVLIAITVANPTTGDSDLKVVLTYILLPTP